ncbi:peptidoglycan recognition protein 1 [Trichonephila clavipes]|nr:peptidoglycan recognition protein 1 [Trichonephila clavipes]
MKIHRLGTESNLQSWAYKASDKPTTPPIRLTINRKINAGWWDIAYNFLVGGDGNIYEGRGWFHTGSHAVNYNTISLGLSFMGNFNKDEPNEAMLNATLNLIKCGVRKGYFSPTREIHGHRDVACTESPGDHLYAVIRNWEFFKGGRLPNYYCRKLPMPDANKDIVNE